jgi:site-specific DNA recombinase
MRAVIYTRVSTKEQSQEGYSLAAQREACAQWIASHEGELVGEFCDAGESARTADRPEFKRLLDALRRDRTIDVLAVHKLDRLARNLEDHAAIRAALRKLDVQLVSITENFERTPSGQLIEGIIASLSEFYSGNLALEIRKGQQQKLKSGWWPGKAPYGYRNVRTEGERREARIEIHPEHGPLIREAFEFYATGSWPLTTLQAHLTERGLHPRSGQISRARLAVTLANPFYIGIMCWQGVDYPGKHEALVTPELFDRVQAVLALKGHQGRQRRNDHPMRGLLHCGECGSRLCFTVAKGRFEYFFCLGRQRDTASYNQPHSPADVVEQLVEAVERRAILPPDLRVALDRALDREVAARVTATAESSRNARRELDRLSTRRSRLLDAYLGGAVNLSDFQAEQSAIRAAIRSAEQRLHRNEAHLREGRRRIDDALSDLKPRSSHRTHMARRQRIFETIEVAAGEVTAVDFRQPYALLLGGSSNDGLVEVSGLEPPTSTLRTFFGTDV